MYLKLYDNSIAVKFVAKYDAKFLCPHLLQVYNHLNLTKKSTKPMTIEEDDFVLSKFVLVDDVIISTLKNELQFFDDCLCDQ
jgi:hypothetical protein